MYRQRMKKEMQRLQSDPGPGISCWKHEDQLQELRAQIMGPDDTPYAGGVFMLSLGIPEGYPYEPPHVRFLTPVYHPNIDSEGRICLDTLKMQPQGSWAPSVNINTLLLSIRLLLAYPNPEDGLVADITEQYKRDLPSFRAEALRCTLAHAVGGSELVSGGSSGAPQVDMATTEIGGPSSSDCSGDGEVEVSGGQDGIIIQDEVEAIGSLDKVPDSNNEASERCDVFSSGSESDSSDSDSSDSDGSHSEGKSEHEKRRGVSKPSSQKPPAVKRRRL